MNVNFKISRKSFFKFMFCANSCTVQIFFALLLVGAQAVAQTPVTTWHYSNARTSANTTEVLLTPSNVNKNSFGKLFTMPVDGFIVGQPLYLPGVNIPGQGTHNVVYVATMHESVYAFDADHPQAGPLWTTSILASSPAGATPVPTSVQKNGGGTGWTEVGIISTGVIDPVGGTLYVESETYESGKIVHRLHALDVTTGQEKLGGPVTIAATFTQNGTISTFTGFYQINRPGLLLANGHIYIGFGSNCCNAYSQGWVISYNASTLQQEGAFDAEPGKALASIWLRGAGLSADSNGNIYAETGESSYYAAGTNLPESVLKLSQVGTTLPLTDWFTPYNHQYLSDNDQDLADGIVILPDQPGSVPHEAISLGKEGTVYILNRDSLGGLCTTCTTTDTQIVQELPKTVGFESGTPVYWNNTVYFTGTGKPVMAFTMSNGKLTVPPAVQSLSMPGGGHAVLTANGNNNAILWLISGSPLYALDAHTLQTLYRSDQAPNGRDRLPPLAHFATQIVADGKVFVGTQNSLAVYGLFPSLSVVAGSGQSATVGSKLSNPVAVKAVDPYSGSAFSGVTVTFSDGGKGGTFSPATAVTDATGAASTSYTLPTKSGSYTLTASAPGYGPGTFTETATPGTATKLLKQFVGSTQTAPVNSPLPLPMVAKASDAYNNGISGITVSFSDKGAGGTLSASTVITNSSGLAPVNYTTPSVAGVVKIYATAPGLTGVTFVETVTAGPATKIVASSGSGQSVVHSRQVAQPLVAKVTDQYGNPVSGASVAFNDSGAGGSFSANPVVTAATGLASVSYTAPATVGTKTLHGTVSGVSGSATFTVTVQ